MNQESPKDEVFKSQVTLSGEYIAEKAQHWKAESFIPTTVSEMKQALLHRVDDAVARRKVGQVFEALTSVLNHDYRNLHQQMETHYAPLDPDRDLRLLASPTEEQRQFSTEQMLQHLTRVLRAANFTRLDEADIRLAMDATSDWGVRLNVDFDLFDSLEVYCRGDVFGTRRRRHWKTYWRMSEFEIPIYQRLVAVYKLNPEAQAKRRIWGGELDCDRLHLAMFKNIPQADVDMLLPGASIRFSWLDHTKIFAPTLGGIGVTIFKIIRGAIVIAATGIAAMFSVAIVAVGVIGYAIRSLFSYFHTKDKYLLNMTRSLYFQKLDSNAGVIYRLLQEARQQDLLEVILAYFGLYIAEEPVTKSQLGQNCERIVNSLLEIDIRFDVETALEKLKTLGLAVEGGAGTYSVLSPNAAVNQLDEYWDNIAMMSRATTTSSDDSVGTATLKQVDQYLERKRSEDGA